MRTWLDGNQTTPELRAILMALYRALYGRLPNPDLLKKISSRYENVVPGHHVEIKHIPKGDLDKRRAYYRISISGMRIDANWNFTPGHFNELINDIGLTNSDD